jgi:hypothetical protein
VSYQYPGGQAAGDGQYPPGVPPAGRGAAGHAARARRGKRARVIAGGVLAVAGVALLAGGVVLAAGGHKAGRPASSQPTLSAAALAGLATNSAAWTQIPVQQLFPAKIVSSGSDVSWVRLGVSPPASCSTALTSDWSSDPTNPCQEVLRATYTDQARSILATIAIVVLPASIQDPSQQWPGLNGADQAQDYPTSLQSDVQYPVNVMSVPGTPAAHWTDADVQAFNGTNNGSFNFVSIVETGTLDGRAVGDLPAHWASEKGGAFDREDWIGPGDDLSSAYGTYLFNISGGAAG